MPMEQLFKLMSEKKASDLFIAPGSPLHLKLNGNMVPIGQQKLTPETVTSLLREVISEKKWLEFENTNELNLGHGVPGIGSFRISSEALLPLSFDSFRVTFRPWKSLTFRRFCRN
jgi:twitching motility protein PilU